MNFDCIPNETGVGTGTSPVLWISWPWTPKVVQGTALDAMTHSAGTQLGQNTNQATFPGRSLDRATLFEVSCGQESPSVTQLQGQTATLPYFIGVWMSQWLDEWSHRSILPCHVFFCSDVVNTLQQTHSWKAGWINSQMTDGISWFPTSFHVAAHSNYPVSLIDFRVW